MKFFEKTLKSQYVYQGKILKIRVDQVELPDGGKSQREIVEHPGAVAIIAFTKDKKLIMVRQYRKPVEKEILEIPAGKLSVGEDPLLCARRELIEETGYQAEELKLITKYYTTPGFCNEILYLYLAIGLKEVGQSLDKDEFLEMVQIPLTDAQNMVFNGDIEDAKTIIGILAVSSLVSP